MEKLLILCPLGSEVRQFGHSGVVSRLLDLGWRVYVAASLVDDDFTSQWDPRVTTVSLPKHPLPFLNSQIAVILDRAHEFRERRSGRTGWVYKVNKVRNWRHWLLLQLQQACARILCRIPAIYQATTKLERFLRRRLRNSAWERLFDVLQPDVLLVNVPRGFAFPLAIAERRGLATVLAYHTWKDASALGRLDHCYTAVGTWNSTLTKSILRQNPDVKPHRVVEIGCAHFDCIGRPDFLPENEIVRSTLNCDASSRVILFPASAPWMVPEEERYVGPLWRAIHDGELPGDLRIVVRTNPMDRDNVLESKLREQFPDILISRPDWRWDAETNWCFQRKSDLSFYNLLLHRAVVCVGVPSTVTVECSVARLPVINVGFDLPGPKPFPGTMSAFWEADFYSDVRSMGAAVLASSPADLVRLVNVALRERDLHAAQQARFVERQLAVRPGEAAFALASLIEASVVAVGNPGLELRS